jgi:hypothetical protein
MTDTTLSPGATRAQPSLVSRMVGVIFSPRETFQAVAAAPHWFGVLAVVGVIGAAALGGFLFTSVGQQAWLDAAVSQRESMGMTVSDEQYAMMERMASFAGYFGLAQGFVVIPLGLLILCGILYAVFNAALGGNATFKPLYAVAAHSTVIFALGWLFVMPLNYARGSMTSPTNLAALVPMLEEGSFIVRLLGAIDLFMVWWTVGLGIGLAVLYRRRTQPVVISLLCVYAVIAVIVAGVMSAMGGS